MKLVTYFFMKLVYTQINTIIIILLFTGYIGDGTHRLNWMQNGWV